jgi:hypothetical protein
MGARGAVPLILVVGACTSAAPPPFEVIFSSPRSGDSAFPDSPVELGFSEAIDRNTCTRDTIHLGAVDEDFAVVWFAVYTVVEAGGDNRWSLDHDGMVDDVNYLLAVDSGPSGCLSAMGEEILPFSLVFPVLEPPDAR